MNFARQFLGILLMNLSGFRQRIAPVLTIIIGVACAVGVLVSMLAMGAGARRQEIADVRADHVVLITSGASYGQSNISRDEVTTILGLPGILKGTQGEPIVVPIPDLIDREREKRLRELIG